MSHIRLQHTINIKWDEPQRERAREREREGTIEDIIKSDNDDGNVVCLSWFF